MDGWTLCALEHSLYGPGSGITLPAETGAMRVLMHHVGIEMLEISKKNRRERLARV